MILIEFTVEGPPLSHQTRDRGRLQVWRDTVRAAAAAVWGARMPAAGNLKITVAYYHEGPAVLIDNDNMVKPIQDAMNRLVYTDDRQITLTEVRKSDIDGSFFIRGISPTLLAAFAAGNEFLYVKVESAPDPARLPG